MKMIDNILELNGLSVEILKELSYQSKLGMSIKKNLHYFDRDILLKELFDMAEWKYEGPWDIKKSVYKVNCINKDKLFQKF